MPPKKLSEARLPSGEISVRACVLPDPPRLSSDPGEPWVSWQTGAVLQTYLAGREASDVGEKGAAISCRFSEVVFKAVAKQ